MTVKNKKATTAKKRSRVKVGKLSAPTKELSAKEQKKVKGGSFGGAISKKVRVTITNQISAA